MVSKVLLRDCVQVNKPSPVSVLFCKYDSFNKSMEHFLLFINLPGGN